MSSPPTYSEQELVSLLKDQDEKAFSYLYDNYAGALYGVITSIISDKEIANDVLQVVFTNIWKKINSYDSVKGRLFTWMLNIARNASIDEIRSRGYKEGQKNQPFPENVDTHTANAITPAVMGDAGLKKIIMKLKTELRVLIELSYFQGYTHDEISKALNIPLGTVKTRIRTALTQLRTMLQ